MLQEFLLLLVMIGCLLIGFVFIGIFSYILHNTSKTDRQEELSQTLAMGRMEIVNEQIDLLYQIGKPDLSTGEYSDEKMSLWDIYWQKENEYEMQFQKDMDIIYA